jgi:glycosyltransferase involved in cell wall biosynthesis
MRGCNSPQLLPATPIGGIMEVDKRPRVLCVSDSAAIDTGMGVAHREIAGRLYATNKYNVASFGWFWKAGVASGCKWTFPWKQYSTDDNRHPYGHPPEWNHDYNQPNGNWKECALRKVVEQFNPNVVIAIADTWMADYIYFMPNRHTFKLIHEVPIDGEPIPASWANLLRGADAPVVMSKYALRVMGDVDKFLRLHYIPRGICTHKFKPYTNKNELRKKHLPSTENRFVVGVFDRFQDRKQIPRSVEGFAKFKNMHKNDNCDLYLHMCINDSFSMSQKKSLLGDNGIVERYGIVNNVLVNNNLSVEKGVDVKDLVALYNCCDVKLSSTQGEGFGLTTLEALACGIPCIATNYTTMPELLGDGRGLLANVAAYLTGMYNVERALVDTDSIASNLEILYRSEGLRNEMSERSRAFALNFDWSNIIPKWETLIDNLIERPKYSLMGKPKEVRIEKSKHEINVCGALYENTGFSIVTARLARGLHTIGESVSIEPRESSKPSGMVIADDVDKMASGTKFNDVAIINHMPDECRRRIKESTARIKIAYFPWELTEVKNEWIDLINRECDAYVCNSSFVANIFKDNGANANKVHVVPNGVCINSSAKPYEFKTKKKYKFLMVGNLGDNRKNVITLIQAYLNSFNSDDDVCLVLKSQPGHNNSDPSELCENLKRSYKNPAELEVIHEDLPDLSGLYTGSDCFVTATRVEGFCQPILDALSVGLPVIAPNYGGYKDFIKQAQSAGIVKLIGGNLVNASACPVYLEGSVWFDISIDALSREMRSAYESGLKRTGINYVTNHTWGNAGRGFVDIIKAIEKQNSKVKIYYNNFSRNMWNDDNRTNIMRYAPSEIEFVDSYENADYQVLDIAKLSDFDNVRCKRYVVNFHCRGMWSEENIKDYLPFFKKAIAVYSHIDLKAELPELENFVMGPWGVDHRAFYKTRENKHKFIILNTGSIPQTEGIYESVAAADVIKKDIIHTGPNLGIRNKSYNVCKNFLTKEQLRQTYQNCSYTSGMRRKEGFEKTVLEGLLCGSRPICFDTPLYRGWYGNLVEYVVEGDMNETTNGLLSIFTGPYRDVTDEERAMVKKIFSWQNVATNYWKNITKLMGVKS